MKMRLDSEGVPALTQREVAILLALAQGSMTGYEVGQQCATDAAGRLEMSNGTLYPALKRLEKMGLVGSVPMKAARPGKSPRLHELKQLGRLMLEWELGSYRRLLRVAENRL